MPIKRRFLALAAALLPWIAIPADAAGGSQACRDLVQGTYLSSIVEADGSLISRSIVTFAADGTWLSIDSNQEGIPGAYNPFTENAGEWACTGRHTLTASALSFSLPGPEGPGKSLARNEMNATVDPSTQKLEGTIELIFFPLEADPFKDAGASAGVFRFTATPLVLRAR